VRAQVPWGFHGQSKARPAVIIHISGQTVFVCPFYSKPRPRSTYVAPTKPNGLNRGSNLSYKAVTIGRQAILKRLGVIDPSIGNWLLPGHWANSVPVQTAQIAQASRPGKSPKRVVSRPSALPVLKTIPLPRPRVRRPRGQSSQASRGDRPPTTGEGEWSTASGPPTATRWGLVALRLMWNSLSSGPRRVRRSLPS